MEDSILIKNLFKKYNIDDLVGLKGKYLDAFVRRIIYEYKVFDKISFSTSKYSNIKGFYLKSLIIIGGALLSYFKTLKYKERKVQCSSRILAIPYADHIVRFKRIHDISDEKIDIVYPPLFHFSNINKHLEVLNKGNSNIVLGCFSLKSIIKVLGIILIQGRRIKRCAKEIDSYFKSCSCKLPGSIILAILYRAFIVKFIKNNLIVKKSHIWIFDYDFDLKYIVFNDTIHKIYPNDTTIHMQHGSFFSYHDSYCHPLSDFSLCCSPREKKLIEKYNKYQSKIISFGAPLQTFIDSDYNEKVIQPDFDILILLSAVYNEEQKKVQIDFLKNLDYHKYRYLIRYRPASRYIDEKYLGSYIGKASISNNMTLQEDINRSKIIVSFSEDALYTAIRNNKKIVFITLYDPSEIYNFDFQSSNMKIISHKECSPIKVVEQMFGRFEEESYDTDPFILYNFGVNDLKTLKRIFTNFIDSLLK